MRIILLQDVENVGKKYDVKIVKAGFARNFLIPKGLAKPATKKAMKWLQAQKEKYLAKIEEDLKKFQKAATAIDGHEFTIPVKLGPKGQLFESITPQKISEALKKADFDIKKSQIYLKEPIRELGEFPVKIKFAHNLESEITIIVTEEK
ncbi:hypothetical protein AMJ50_02655 [Parcubacteria bacterium DG_74_3]|nr:MAG: hypothetical protein AMJ50_02655 [Parcubacteria bacterium DG_74_3]